MANAGDTLTLETSKGPVVIEMNSALAPAHVAHIKRLVSEGFYDGIVFHRVEPGFVVQTGDPTGTGSTLWEMHRRRVDNLVGEGRHLGQ